MRSKRHRLTGGIPSHCTQSALREYEEKLGLVAEYKDRSALIASVCESIDGLMKRAGSSEIREELEDIKAVVKRLDR